MIQRDLVDEKTLIHDIAFKTRMWLSLAALIIRETAAAMISRFFVMALEKGEMMAHGNKETKLWG